MKWMFVLGALLGCGATTTTPAPAAGPSAALAHLEQLRDVRGEPLPPRADAPRTVVMFFASW